MLDPQFALYTALYSALTTPPLLLDSAPFPVYTHVQREQYDYLLISQPTANTSGGSAGCTAYDCTVLLSVYTSFPVAGQVSELPAYDLSSQVLSRLLYQRIPLPLGLSMSPVELAQATTVQDSDDSRVYVMRHLRLRFSVYEQA